MIKLEDSEREIKIEDLITFEIENEITLPKSFKDFLMNSNGGYPEDDLFFGRYIIDGFNSIVYGDYHIQKIISNLSGALPKNSIPFAHSNGGVIFMSLKTDDYEKVYIMYSDGQTDFLAESFEKFMNGLSKEQDL